jgi:hypothetical protein
MNIETELDFNNKVDDRIKKVVPNYLQKGAFMDRKLTDTPTDNFQVVNRQYVTLNGTSTKRPTSSIVGQFYLDMTLASGRGKPIWWNGTGFVDATGTYV